MLASTPCPDLHAYRQLTSGQLAVAEAESLLGHLATCDACAGKIQSLPASDSLIDWIQQAKSSTPSPDEKQLGPLMQRLIQLGKPAAMVTFSCAACRKPLRVKAEAAGKKVKCPHCGQVVLAAAATLPVPAATIETAVLPPASSSMTATVANLPASSRERELCAFLSPSQAPDEIGRLGSYRVLKVLGAGGMGVVFRAEDPQLQRIVALKAMLPALAANEAARQRFFREARLAASLKHDHVVTIYQVSEDRSAPYLAMEFLEGESLEDRLKREGKLPLAEVLRIGREIADGLQAAHEHGLIHRDIKPANIWLEARSTPLSPLGRGVGGEGFRVKILDFGLARSSGDDVHLTQSGAIVGTPAYMPPEQARGESVDARCDLYSLGCVLYRLCTGELPFKGDNTMSLLLALAVEQPKSPRQINPDVPPALEELILRLLAKKPADRPATASEVADALQSIASAKNPVPEAAGVPAPPRRRRKLLAAAAAVFLLSGMLAIIVIVRNKQGDEIARVNVPEGGSVEVKDEDRGQNLPKRQGGRDDLDTVKTPPPVQVPEPPPLTEWLKGRKVLTVSQDGKGQFKTIQAALNALKPGQVVKVLDRGPYRESLKVVASPTDTGLISEQGAVLEVVKWGEHPAGHELGIFNGFRFSGFKVLGPAPVAKEWRVLMHWGTHPRGLVIEDCYFRTSESVPAIDICFDGGELNAGSVWLRHCFMRGSVLLRGNDEGRSIVTIEQNYFQEGGLWCESDQLKLLALRHNVFALNAVQFMGIKGPMGLEIYNNTIRNGVLFHKAAPSQRVVLRNNVVRNGWQLDEGAEASRADAIKNWSVGPNACPDYLEHPRTLPLSPHDSTSAPNYLSLDSASADYLRPATDSPLAKGGAGGAWPSYIGALPPGPAPKEGDWFTRLRQRWGDVAPAYKPLSAPVQIPEPPLLTEWLKGRKVLTVAQDGKGQFKTIQAALDALKPGQVVKVLDRGPYRERLTLENVPADSGLISEQGTRLEFPGNWRKVGELPEYEFTGHHLANTTGFRLHGFCFTFPEKKDGIGLFLEQPDGFVLEHCWFPAAGSRRDGYALQSAIRVSTWQMECVRPVVFRESLFDGPVVFVTAENEPRGTDIVLEKNCFTDFCQTGGPFRKLILRNNLFDPKTHLSFYNQKDAALVEMINNTILRDVQFEVSAPRGTVHLCNNLITGRESFQLNGGAEKVLPQVSKSWQSHHNVFQGRAGSGLLPLGATDRLALISFLSQEPGDVNYLRLPADSPLGKGGAGGAWPSYIGALPPGPAPKDGDWFTRLREKWLKDKPATRK